MAVGSEQAVISAGLLAGLGNGAGLSEESISYYIAKLFGGDLNFMAGIVTYIFADQLSRFEIFDKNKEGKN